VNSQVVAKGRILADWEVKYCQVMLLNFKENFPASAIDLKSISNGFSSISVAQLLVCLSGEKQKV